MSVPLLSPSSLKDLIRFLVKRAPPAHLTEHELQSILRFPPRQVAPILVDMLAEAEDPIFQLRVLDAMTTIIHQPSAIEHNEQLPAAIVQEMLMITVHPSSPVDLTPRAIMLLNSFPVDLTSSILITLLTEEEDAFVQSRIFDGLMHLQDFDCVAYLTTTYDIVHAGWKLTYCEQLTQYHDPRAVNKLCSILLTDPDADLRYQAADGLRVIGDLTALEALEQALNHDTGSDYEGLPIARAAATAIDAVKERHRGSS